MSTGRDKWLEKLAIIVNRLGIQKLGLCNQYTEIEDCGVRNEDYVNIVHRLRIQESGVRRQDYVIIIKVPTWYLVYGLVDGD